MLHFVSPLRSTVWFIPGAVLCLPAAVRAADDARDANELAKALSNPLAALISVPLQLNYDAELGGDSDGERWTLNLQPVVPLAFERWNLISRTILPVVALDAAPVGSESGLGDVLQSLFFSPKTPFAGRWIWGAGPVLMVPTATDERLGSGHWAIGPTAVALRQTATGWTFGTLVNHLTSFAGDGDRGDVEATFIQPFVSRAVGAGRTLALNLESTFDWESDEWNLPLNLSYSRVLSLGGQLVSISGGPRAYLDAPPGGADWGLRVSFTLLYPK